MNGLRFETLSPVLTEFLARYGFGPGCDLSLAGTAGSRREYYRLKSGLRSFVILLSPSDDVDFGRFLRITQFYRLLRFPVPMVYCIDDAAHQVVLEDLGDRRLYDHLLENRPQGLDSYRKTLDLLVDLQTRCQALHQECPDIRSRIFDRGQLLWETSYFRAQYLEGHRGVTPDATLDASLGKIFDELADLVDRHPKAIMHRDFQSQNLMVTSDGAVHAIDYQGSRLGSIYYDLASLLLDPYVMLTDAEMEDLLRYFHAKSLNPLEFSEFRAAFVHAGLQRIMQALGAFCFLSRVKGIESFASHIEPGEKRLRWLLKESGRPEWRSVLSE
jgi:aminoglycoside/choline kinase family phosphotransferase